MFMPCSLQRGLASRGATRHIQFGSTTAAAAAPRFGWQSVKRATIMATADSKPTEFEIASAQLKARVAELPDSITDEQLEAMNVEAFTALCSTAREHIE
jgi:hypothetical protein